MIISSVTELQHWYTQVYERNNKEWFDFEAIIQSVYEALLHEGDVAIDGGAHVGRHSIPMARRVGPTGAVFAFEPISEVVRSFRQHIDTHCADLKSVIRLQELAISDYSGKAEFLVAEDPGYSGLRERIYPREMPLNRRQVVVDRLDVLCRGVGPVRFIKLDLEGGEYHAMKGGWEILKQQRPVVVFEYDRFHTPRFYGYEHADLLGLFQELDFRVMDVIGTPFDSPSIWDGATLWYYFAVPREAGLDHTISQAIEHCIQSWAPWYKLPEGRSTGLKF